MPPANQILGLVDEDLCADGVLQPGPPLERLLPDFIPEGVDVLLAGRHVRQLVGVGRLHTDGRTHACQLVMLVGRSYFYSHNYDDIKSYGLDRILGTSIPCSVFASLMSFGVSIGSDVRQRQKINQKTL